MRIPRASASLVLALGVAVACLTAPAAGVDAEQRGDWKYRTTKHTSHHPGDHNKIHGKVEDVRIKAAFEPHGDEFWVKDLMAEGRSVGVLVKVRGGKKVICRNKSGEDGGWGICDLSLSEKRNIRWKPSYCNGSTEAHQCKRRGEWIGWDLGRWMIYRQ